MSQINPLIGSILQTPAAQRLAAADRDKQLRRVADTAKNAYLLGDRLELSVESSDAAEPAKDEQQRRQPQDERDDDADEKPSDGEAERLDIKA